MSNKELEKELKKDASERVVNCNFGKIVDFHIYDSRIEKGKFVYCDMVTIKNHIVTKVYCTYDVEKKHLEVTDLKNLY